MLGSFLHGLKIDGYWMGEPADGDNLMRGYWKNGLDGLRRLERWIGWPQDRNAEMSLLAFGDVKYHLVCLVRC